MSVEETETTRLAVPSPATDRKKGWFAACGVIGAILASMCCVVPLVFVMLGVSGAWIGNLTALEPYKPLFAGITLAFIRLGFRQVYFRAKPACEAAPYCALPETTLITRSALWLSTVLVALALTIKWWAPFFY